MDNTLEVLKKQLPLLKQRYEDCRVTYAQEISRGRKPDRAIEAMLTRYLNLIKDIEYYV